MLTSIHSAFDVRIYEKEAKSLVAAGYKLAIVAPDGKSGKSDAVEIVRVRLRGNRLRRMTRGIWDVYRRAKEINADVYHLHDPELVPVGLLLKICGKQVIYDVHEDLPRDILAKTWISPRLRRPVAAGASLMHFLSAPLFDGIIAATPVIAARFPSNKVLTIQNFPRLEQSNKIPLPYVDRSPFVAYIGGISRQRGISEMVKSMSMLRGFPDARLLLAGEFEEVGLERELKGTPGFDRVDYRGWLTRTEVSEALRTSKSGLVLLHPIQMFMESQPIKLFEYMAAGIPVIASDFPLWRAIVGKTSCGLLVDPQNPRDIAEAIEWILGHPEEAEQMGQRGAAAIRSKYNWEAESEKLVGLYSNLMNERTKHSLRHTAATN
jgi:glycosyltransferase involved in cell wall biosynthesis